MRIGLLGEVSRLKKSLLVAGDVAYTCVTRQVLLPLQDHLQRGEVIRLA